MDKATIVDVAREAGVSTATVSRVLNDNYPVSQHARLKVQKAIQSLHYEINRAAQSLKSCSTHMISFIVADISNAYFITVARGLESVLSANGYVMICSSSNESIDKEREILRTLQQHQVGGIVLLTCGRLGESAEDAISATTPYILVDSDPAQSSVDVVGTDEHAAMRLLTEHVIACGHRRIAILNGDLDKHTGYERHLGFLDAMNSHGLPVLPQDELQGMFLRSEAEKCVRKMLLSGNPLPDALICASNQMTEGALCVLHKQGVSIPDTLSLASYNQVCPEGVTKVEITHLSENAFEIGLQTGRLLLEKISALQTGKLIKPRVVQLVKTVVAGQSILDKSTGTSAKLTAAPVRSE